MLDQREEGSESRKKEKRVEFPPQRAGGAGYLRSAALRFDLNVERLLKSSDALVKTQAFRREWVSRGQFTGTSDAFIPLSVFHFLVAIFRSKCSYQMR